MNTVQENSRSFWKLYQTYPF